jgi:osmoprotectant transport system substrate-binding protein
MSASRTGRRAADTALDSRRFFVAALVCALIVLLSSCAIGGTPTPLVSEPAANRTTIRVGSYEFQENQVLAEVYGAALRRAGLPVEVLVGLGTREIVAPALEQGYVDFVVDYMGSSLNWVDPGNESGYGQPDSVYNIVRTKYAERGIDALPFAQAEDQNGYVVRETFSRQRQVTRISDLAPIAGSLVFGGPPECPARRFCLIGLRDVYGLNFRDVRLFDRRADIAAALTDGEIDVGMLETTDPRLSGTELVLLEDDRGLQPRENIVPLVRDEVMNRYGQQIMDAVAPVTAALTTVQLIELNRAVAVNGLSPKQAAQAWLDRQGV